MSFKIYNSLTQKQEPLEFKNKKINWYTCGPTVYDNTHLGHARNYILNDLMIRTLNFLGYDVTYGMNITDIDDKIIRKSLEQKVSPKEISELYLDKFIKDMKLLNMKYPDKIIRVTDVISDITKDIKLLLDNELAIKDETGINFNSKKYNECKLVLPTLKKIILEEDSDMDFCLWKFRNEEKNEFGYSSILGYGVPGWHMECTTISHLMFPYGIDVHSGGIDLAFPHHHNEIIQNNCLDYVKEKKEPFIKKFVHIGHIHILGKKMSKSLKNFITIQDILKQYSPDELRLFMMLHKYHVNIDIEIKDDKIEIIDMAKSQLQYIYNFIEKYKSDSYEKDKFDISNFQKLKLNIYENLQDNFNYPEVIKIIISTISEIYKKESSMSAYEIVQFIDFLKHFLISHGFNMTLKDNGIYDIINDFRTQFRTVLTNKSLVTIEDLKKELWKLSDIFRSELHKSGHMISDTKLDKSQEKKL